MNLNELRSAARDLGISAKGTKEDLAERIFEAQAAARRSRRGMKLVAKGDKVSVFRAAAEAAGYSVGVKSNRQTGGTVAYAVKGEHRVTAAWTESGVWDRPNSRVTVTGEKGRMSRNLADAIKSLLPD
jgi:hypothetical protein